MVFVLENKADDNYANGAVQPRGSFKPYLWVRLMSQDFCAICPNTIWAERCTPITGWLAGRMVESPMACSQYRSLGIAIAEGWAVCLMSRARRLPVGAIHAAALISARISLSPLKIEIEENAIANLFLL